MPLSVLDLFTVGIGPSSSHSVGPMRAANQFIVSLKETCHLSDCVRIEVRLYGSLALTGKGHGTDKAVLLGLEGERPESVDPDTMEGRLAAIRESQQCQLPEGPTIAFCEETDLLFLRKESLPFHPNGIQFSAFGQHGQPLAVTKCYSVGGGFVVGEDKARADSATPLVSGSAYPFKTGKELLQLTSDKQLSISDCMLAIESTWRSEAETHARLLTIWKAMQDCVTRGFHQRGILPGGLKVRRRAPELFDSLARRERENQASQTAIMEWVNVFAMAVAEENAAGSRVVTAPTNGAAGVIPAVLHYYVKFVPQANEEGIVRFLLAAGAIGILYKLNASLSGAEVGCQGEIGVACSMAAGGLVEALGGTPQQVEMAAEIGMEHNLGLTCDPIGGLVQIPCIERCAMAAVKAINASTMALNSDGTHHVSLDRVIRTMRDTGRDMLTKYKETSRGGLAVAFTEC